MSILEQAGSSILSSSNRDGERMRDRRDYEERPRNESRGTNYGYLNDTQFIIDNLELIPIVKQQPVYLRPYSVVGDGRTVDRLSDRIISGDTSTYRPHVISGYVAGILRPSTESFATAADRRWFAEEKFIFRISIRSRSALTSTETITHCMGFTNHADLIDNGRDVYIPKDMVFEMTSLIENYIVDVDMPGRDIQYERIRHVYDVLSGRDSIYNYTQRPIDMYGYMRKEDFLNRSRRGDSPYQYGGAQTIVRNPTSELGGTSDRVEPSKKSNNMGSYYLSSILQEGIKSEKLRQYETETNSYYGDEDVISDILEEPSILDNDFIAFLNQQSNYHRFKGTFTYGDLLELDRRGAEEADIVEIVRGGRNDPLDHTPDSGERWDGRDNTSVVAVSMLESTIALAVKYGFTQMRVVVDGLRSSSLENDMVKILPPTNSILRVSDHDYEMLADKFRDFFMTTIYMQETNSGRIPLFAEVIVDLYGNSKINLGIGGDRPEWFTLPTAVNKYTAQINSPDKKIVMRNKDLIGSMVRNISEETERRKNYR